LRKEAAMNAPDRPRRATNLHLEAELVDEARGLRGAVAEEKARCRWRAENAEGTRQMNDWVAKHGLPLAKYRMF
jgi:antitoxin CcdA